jgi:hypothetical protein
MSPFQTIAASSGPNVDNGAALGGVVIVTVIVVAVLGAALWGFVRLRSVNPVLKKSVSNIREQRFASEILREFAPDSQHASAGAQGAVLETGILPKPAPGPETSSKKTSDLADEVPGGGVAGDLEGFYANALTSKPVRAAGPTTGTLTYGSSRPEVSGVFGVAVREFVEGIRGLATVVEQAALLGGGSELDRAARSVDAFTRGLGALPINAVLVSAARDVVTEPCPSGTHGIA